MTGRRIRIMGTVQGVGFRPWVYRLAHEEGLAGWVRNGSGGVTIEAFGPAAALDAFVTRLSSTAPPAAAIRSLDAEEIEGRSSSGFQIVASEREEQRLISIPADLATCDDCLAEVFDPADRRYRYPFTNCTNCGPRFTIATDVPYDRPATTMERFALCRDCRSEYENPLDRRFHAQPNACPECGPRLWLASPVEGPLTPEDPLAAAVAAIVAGLVVAIKGLGGFHLACDATSSAAVARLRERKRREGKPFAVMVRDLAMADELARLGDGDRQLLASVERPIVLVPLRRRGALAPEVAPGVELAGLLLPNTALHHLLLAAVGRPLVMTSGNLSQEPMAYRNEEAMVRLGGIADLLLLHDRDIATPCDDSVVRVMAGAPVVMRRSRGWVPRPIEVPWTFPGRFWAAAPI